MRKERPILYSTPMIRAKLAGLKTQTRRKMNPQIKPCRHDLYEEAEWKHLPTQWSEINLKQGRAYCRLCGNGVEYVNDAGGIKCPYGKVGDVLYAREAWQVTYGEKSDTWSPIYKADGYYFEDDGQVTWRPSIHMRKEHSRIWDEIVDIRVERLQDISKEDAIAEGIEREESGQELVKETFYKNYLGDGINVTNWTRSPVASYKSLWEKINGIGSWDENPWVWVIVTRTLSTTGRDGISV